MNKAVAITGLGAISPFGHSVADICGPTKRADDGHVVRLSNQTRVRLIENFDAAPFLGERLKRKLDLFAIYGLCAAEMALKDSGLQECGTSKERIGVFVGNCLGGWGFTEPELRLLHSRGVGAMGPYVATAWFPAAVQGQISLAHSLTGYSKTFSASDVAGVQALGYAARAIQSGRADAIVCGAAESLASPYMQAVLGNGKPGDVETFAEGAAFLVIEDYQQALVRGARIYGMVSGFDDRFVAHPDQESAQSSRGFDAIGTPDAAASLRLGCGGAPKSKFGQMFAVSGPMEVVCGAYHLYHQTLTAEWFEDQASFTQAPTPFTQALVQCRGARGGVVSLGIAHHHHR